MIDGIREELDDKLRLLADRAKGALAAPVLYAVPGGKRVRGTLLVLAGGSRANANLVEAAACLELLHAATLVQDDICDRSRTRRGRPAVYRVFGPRLAMLAADWMLAEAMRAAYRLHSAYGEALGACAQAMIAGEARELTPSAAVGAASLRARAAAIALEKTGELFGLALSAAAVLEGTPRRAARLRKAGCALGTAFQYLDDALDLYGEGQEAGKDLQRDSAAGLWTLPMLDARAMRGGELQGAVFTPLLLDALVRAVILTKARRQWQTALQGVLGELPVDSAVGTLLRDLAGQMLAPTEACETRPAA